MNLDELLMSSCVTLLMAPPAFGKTFRLLELYKGGKRKMIFVSPLRALAQEFSAKNKGSILIERRREAREQFEKFFKKKKALLVVTPELLNEDVYYLIEQEKEKIIVVLDEFHLFYKWGEEFRPILFESFMGLLCTQAAMLCLTATMNEEVLESFKRDAKNVVDDVCIVNLGNYALKYLPTKIHYFPFSKKIFIRRFLYELHQNKEQNLLFFCEFRHEVDYWGRYCERKKIKHLVCKGGEVLSFVEKLKNYSGPGCIFATTALSHGVNLPTISKVFLSYRERDRDLWPQMVARGGRNGEGFELYCQNLRIFQEKSFKLKRMLAFLFFDLYLRVREYFYF